MTANSSRLHWPEWLCRLLKMDAYGNLPKWWQWFFPRYGNWGGPGWSAGRWNPSVTDWLCPGIDAMDILFYKHDCAYQNGHDRDVADRKLVLDLRKISVTGAYARVYRIGAIICFTAWPRVRSAFGGSLMRRILCWVFLIILLLVSSYFAFDLGTVYAGAPPLSASELADVPAAAVSTINQEAHWIWQILISDTANSIAEWIFTAGISALVGWLGLTGTRMAQCIMYIAAGVRAVYASFVRPAKQRADNGKLSEADRVEAVRLALDYAGELARTKGFELLEYFSKDIAATIVELFVRLFKGKKAEVLIPLSEEPPLPPSVTEGARPA